MSVTLYLNDKVQKKEGFTVKKRYSKDGHEWNEYHLSHIHLFIQHGRFTASGSLEGPIPEILKDVLEEISFYEWVPLYPHRMRGTYKHKDVTGILGDGQKDHCELRIRGKTLKNIRDLYCKIRAGTILPEESWEEKQITSRKRSWLLRIFFPAWK